MNISIQRPDNPALQIAIIGTGIAGASAAYFLREQLGAAATIVAFEQAPQVGGRMQRRDFAGASIETGATLLHSSNAYMAHFMDRLGLERTQPHQPRAGESQTTAIWNGNAIVWQSHPQAWRSQARMLARYGRAPIQARALTQAMLARWTRIYDLQQRQQSYATPQALFGALDLYAETQQSSYDFFAEHQIAPRFVREFVDGISRSNYGQCGAIHAFVNLISLTGSGIAGGSLFSIAGGNVQVCQGLLRLAGIDVRTNTSIAAIAAAPGDTPGQPRYRITTHQRNTETFDAVVIATPLERTSIRFVGIRDRSPAPIARQSQVTHATFVAGRLNPGYFGQSRAVALPRGILTTENPQIPFSAIGRVGHSPTYGVPIYKIFSREALDDALIGRLFAQPQDTLRIKWHAYPVLQPSPAWEPFRLQHGLYYVNAMESAVSAMETEAVASRNVAQLLIQDVAALRHETRNQAVMASMPVAAADNLCLA